MGWFDEQIRNRKRRDDQIFTDSLKEAAWTALGKQNLSMEDDRVLTGSALEKILRYYHLDYVSAPEGTDSLDEQLEYTLHPQGMMYRKVLLKEGWYKEATGAYLGFRKSSGAPLALIPSGILGYRCYDVASGESFLITKKTMADIREDAYCFYRPFPQSSLNIGMLIKYMLGILRFPDFVLIVFVSFLSSMVGILFPRLTNLLYGKVLGSGSVSALIAIALFMLAVRASSLVIDAGGSLITGVVQTRLTLSVESASMMRVLSLPPEFFREYNAGELSSRMQSINSLCSAIVNATLRSGLTSVTSLVYITQIFRYTPALVIPSLAIIVVTVGFSVLTMVLEVRRQKSIMVEDAKTQGLSFALVGGIQKIRLAGAEKRTFAHWARSYNKVAQLTFNPPTILKVSSVITQGIGLGGTIILYMLALGSNVTVSDFMSFNVAYGVVMGAFSSLAATALVFARIKPVLEMAKPILDAVPETGERKKVLTDLKGNIQLDNVSFRYTKDGPMIVDNLSLKIKAGDYVAIVGPSGCGKSTLVRLLLGFETPEKGGIFYDGKNIDQIDLKSLRRRIGTVMQNGGLFNDSIYANIALSAPSLPMEDAWEAAEAACIADDIREMPMGMFTMISEGQGGISGGQKQRIMIARALAPKPSVLIFDEATSALDNIAQKNVTDALDNLHCTRIVIAHRLSTIQSCSRILYLGSGKVLEEGTYEELMEKNGLFAEMVARQQI